MKRIGLRTYLPQQDGGLLSDLVKQGVVSEDELRLRLFAGDLAAIRASNAVLAVLDGRVVDEGVCVEVGIAFALGLPCLGFKTDTRSALRGRDNLMLEGVLSVVARTWVELEGALGSLSIHQEAQ